MKTKIIFISITVFLCISFDVSAADTETNKIIISEIQIGGVKANDEFVRLKNETDETIDVTGFRLTKKSISGGICKENPLVSTSHFIGIIAPRGAFTIAHPSYKDTIGADLEYSSASYYLSNNTVVILYDMHGVPLDKKAVGEDCTLIVDPVDPPIAPPSAPQAPIVYDVPVRLNELLANPSGDEGKNEFIELFNPSDTIIDLSSWTIKDASAGGKYVFPNDTKIQPKGFLVVYRSTFKFALNNSNERVSLLDPNGLEKDSVSYKTAKEDVCWNYTATGFQGGMPTPGAVNQPNNLPQTREKVPEKGYRGVAIDFDARGGDVDHDTLKYTWDFGDDHKSYKERTSHTYDKNGTYTVTLKTSDGKDDEEETFTLEIESYPHLEIRITSLLPNPDGADTDNEWLLIENREKKTVNLKGYSIATGWKNLVNHPIREDFLIKSKKEARLTHDFSLFTLPNQKGKIELRAPDGKVLQSIRYKLDKPAAENAIYRKEKGSAWKWDIPTKKRSQSPEKEIFPLVLGISDTKPAEELQSEGEDLPTEKRETKSDQISLDPDRPLPQDILAYGTRVHIPDTITLTFPPSEETNMIPVSESSPLPSEESIFSKINTALNAFLNAAR